jgi:hypothetical protein
MAGGSDSATLKVSLTELWSVIDSSLPQPFLDAHRVPRLGKLGERKGQVQAMELAEEAMTKSRDNVLVFTPMLAQCKND